MANPTEAWPLDAAVEALDGTTDARTGLNYVARGTRSNSSPALQVQFDRMMQRLFAIAAEAGQLRVVKVDATHLGIFEGRFSLGANYFYPGEASKAIALDADDYYVYLTAASDENGTGLATIVTDAAGWPADVSSFIPLAIVTVAGSAIAAIEDVRALNCFHATLPIAGSPAAVFTLDCDNAGAGVNVSLAVNRGTSDAHDAAATWNESTDIWEFFEDLTNSGYAAVKGLSFQSTIATGTAPLTVASTTKVANLNADAVDGLGFTAPAAANALAYSTSAAAVAFTAAPTAADVLFANGSGVPTWGARGTTSGVQAWDADLDALAALASTGIACRTASNTWVQRTITAGTAITVSDGGGVSGNPTVAVTAGAIGTTQLDSGLLPLMNYLGIAADSQVGQVKTVTITAKKADGTTLADHVRVRFWVSDSELGAPNATGHTVTNVTTTQLREITANADYEAIGASGVATFDLTVAAGGTRYVMAEIGGRIVHLTVVITAP